VRLMKTKELANKLSHVARTLDTVALDMTVSPTSYEASEGALLYVQGVIDSSIQELEEIKKWMLHVDTQ